jgi:hypothetical protein
VVASGNVRLRIHHHKRSSRRHGVRPPRVVSPPSMPTMRPRTPRPEVQVPAPSVRSW